MGFRPPTRPLGAVPVQCRVEPSSRLGALAKGISGRKPTRLFLKYVVLKFNKYEARGRLLLAVTLFISGCMEDKRTKIVSPVVERSETCEDIKLRDEAMLEESGKVWKNCLLADQKATDCVDHQQYFGFLFSSCGNETAKSRRECEDSKFISDSNILLLRIDALRRISMDCK